MFKKLASSTTTRRRSSNATAANRRRWSDLHSSSGVSRESGRRSPKAKQRDYEEETQMLHAQIGALEDFIASSPFRDRRNRYQNRDMVPPPDRRAPHARRRRGELSRRELQSLRKERFSHLLTFIGLFASVCAMLYWLLQMME